MTKRLSSSINISILLFIFSLSGCVIHVGNGGKSSDGGGVSSVFGDVGVSAGKHVGDVSSVNGDIELEDNVTAQSVNTVNGSIEIAAGVSVHEANTVNGDIQAKHHFLSQGSVETVNGEISVEHSSEVGGDVETVNGDITLEGVEVKGDIVSKNGSMLFTKNTAISGDIIFRGRDRNSKFSYRKSPPTLTISTGVTIGGDIILHRPVNLNIEDEGIRAKVIQKYSKE